MAINRRDFIHNSVITTVGASVGLNMMNNGMAQNGVKSQDEDNFYLQLVKANDAYIARLLNPQQDSRRSRWANYFSARGAAYRMNAMAAAVCASESGYWSSAEVVVKMEEDIKALLDVQHADGTIDSGNLHSPADTAFVVEPLCTALANLNKEKGKHFDSLKDHLEKFILKAGEGLATGGVHTPNHRWGVCAALARTYSLYPDSKYVNRIDEWLGEGIDIDEDGQFSERSTGNYTVVNDNWFITIARMLHRENLLDPVRRNLEMIFYYLQPDGELESIASRRQDQYRINYIYDSRTIPDNFHIAYRYMAIKDNNGQFAALTRLIEEKAGDKLVNNLGYIIEEPLLKKKLPANEALPTNYAKVLPVSSLARIRRGDISATVYGGSDWPLGVASGLASNPTFFTFRKGQAVLESIRMGCAFFSKGYFRSSGLKVDGNHYYLYQKLEVPYYQPLPKDKRRADGNYELSPAEDRFWSKMDFSNRPMSNIQKLEQEVNIAETNGKFEIEFNIHGSDNVAVSIELCFREGGELIGIEADPDAEGDHFFGEGMAKYKFGNDLIDFGPGQTGHRWTRLSGASYGAHGSSLKAEGLRVYITGMTPFQKKITIG